MEGFFTTTKHDEYNPILGILACHDDTHLHFIVDKEKVGDKCQGYQYHNGSKKAWEDNEILNDQYDTLDIVLKGGEAILCHGKQTHGRWFKNSFPILVGGQEHTRRLYAITRLLWVKECKV